MPDAFDKGDLLEVAVTFKNKAGTNTDPTTVRFKHKSPSGTVTIKTHPTDPEVVKDGTGLYHFDLDLNAIGVWSWRWEGTGTVQSVTEGDVVVRSEFG